MAKVICVSNNKGGTGKSFVSVNLSFLLSKKGYRTLVIDNDASGSLTKTFLTDPTQLYANIFDAYDGQGKAITPQSVRKNLDLIGANESLATISEKDFETIFKLRDLLTDLEGYDYVVIDCPPTLSFLQLAALTASDYCIIPVQPSVYSLQGLTLMFDAIEKVKRRLNPDLRALGIVLNLVSSHGKGLRIEQEIISVLKEQSPELLFDTILHKRVAYDQAPALNMTIHEHDPKGTAGREFSKWFREALSRLDKFDKEGM